MAKPNPRKNHPKRTSRHLTVAIHTPDLNSLREIVRTYALDYGCRPHVFSDQSGSYYTSAVVSEAEFELLRSRDLDVRHLFDQTSEDRIAAATIGKGDRFEGGRIPPQGVGSQPDTHDGNFGSILNVDEINSARNKLSNCPTGETQS